MIKSRRYLVGVRAFVLLLIVALRGSDCITRLTSVLGWRWRERNVMVVTTPRLHPGGVVKKEFL